MPEVTYQTSLELPVDKIWDFVQDMNNWAPFMTGYQSHEIKSETRSIWTLKGDVGILSRTVQLDVNVTEWAGPERVVFTLKGLNEDVDGGGTFTMRQTPAAAPAVAGGVDPRGSADSEGSGAMALSGRAPSELSVERPAPKGLWHRFVAWLMRAMTGGAKKSMKDDDLRDDPASPAPSASAAGVETAGVEGAARSRPAERSGPAAPVVLELKLRMDAGGPMAPMLNAMLGPACAEATEALVDSIAARLKVLHG